MILLQGFVDQLEVLQDFLPMARGINMVNLDVSRRWGALPGRTNSEPFRASAQGGPDAAVLYCQVVF
jgi:hypothetical protein